ncbi:hypothetical protein AOQ84DRAFT_10699 [Glonium stellatum]|uniref:Uncharacterized protein n=1 Tax=Glonium stellatum TaxID=574774 RepID=A0A8E2F3G7_9PEZI|nr:hypothetical protein AOQ84DRAFT_10699 [Glonium stellatum]
MGSARSRWHLLVVVAVVEADTFLFVFVCFSFETPGLCLGLLCMPMSSGFGMGAYYGFYRFWMGFGRIGAWLWELLLGVNCGSRWRDG